MEAVIDATTADIDGAEAHRLGPSHRIADALIGGVLIGCPACGALQVLARSGRRDGRCTVCATVLEHARGTSLRATLALSATTLLLLVPANLLPIYRVDLLAASRESNLASGASLLWQEGFPLPAIDRQPQAA